MSSSIIKFISVSHDPSQNILTHTRSALLNTETKCKERKCPVNRGMPRNVGRSSRRFEQTIRACRSRPTNDPRTWDAHYTDDTGRAHWLHFERIFWPLGRKHKHANGCEKASNGEAILCWIPIHKNVFGWRIYAPSQHAGLCVQPTAFLPTPLYKKWVTFCCLFCSALTLYSFLCSVFKRGDYSQTNCAKQLAKVFGCSCNHTFNSPVCKNESQW